MQGSNINSLLTNPSARMPVALLLDVSGSMNTETEGERRIDRLNEGLRRFITEVKQDMAARFAAEVAIYTFDGQARCVADWAPVTEYDENACTVALGVTNGTNIAAAVNTALSGLDQRLALYRQHGISWHKPWMVVISDGIPTHGDLDSAARSAKSLEASGELQIFPVSVCEEEAGSKLATLSDARRPLFSKSAQFNAFFRFLSASMSSISMSMPGEFVDLKPATKHLEGWETI